MPSRKKRNNLPEVGTVLTKEYRGRVLRAEVCEVDGKAGKVSLKIGSKIYPSPSAAAKDLTGHENNGWKFWGLDRP